MSFHSDMKGLDLHSPSNERVENNTGATLTKLKVITFTALGTSGIYPGAVVISSLSDKVRGVVAEDIISGGTGLVCAFGILQNVNTNAWAPGTLLYSDASGNLTSTSTVLKVGIVLKQHSSSGIIYINLAGEKGDAGQSVALKQDGAQIIAAATAINVLSPLKITDAGSGVGNLKHYESVQVFGGVRDVGGNSTTIISIGEISILSGITMPRNGEIYAISISLNNTRTAGTCTAMAVINGVAQNGASETAVIDETNTSKNYRVLSTPIPYNAGDVINAQSVTSGFTPTAADGVICVFCGERD